MDQAPVLQQHEAALKCAPPQELLDADLDSWRIHWQSQQYHARRNGPVMMMDPPGPDAASIDLHCIQKCLKAVQTQLGVGAQQPAATASPCCIWSEQNSG